MTCHQVADRICLDDAINHKYFQTNQIDEPAAKCELMKIYDEMPDCFLSAFEAPKLHEALEYDEEQLNFRAIDD